MSEGKGAPTPGEWIADTGQHGLRDAASVYAEGADDVALIADCVDYDGDRSVEECQANAHLCAAAKDLLASLKDVIAVSDRATDVYDRARAAIAKAEGR